MVPPEKPKTLTHCVVMLGLEYCVVISTSDGNKMAIRLAVMDKLNIHNLEETLMTETDRAQPLRHADLSGGGGGLSTSTPSRDRIVS